MLVKSISNLLKSYNENRFSKEIGSEKKRGSSWDKLKKVSVKFEKEFYRDQRFSSLSINLADGSGGLAINPFIRIYHPHVSPSGKRGFYVAISFFGSPGEEALGISLGKGRQGAETKSKIDRSIIYEELRLESYNFEKKYFTNRKNPYGFIFISECDDKGKVSVATKKIPISDLKNVEDKWLFDIVFHLCEVYKEYVDECLINDGLLPKESLDKKRLVKIRENHEYFRQEVSTLCGNACVITGCNITEICDAAHIVPYSESPEYNKYNGLLMRADMHRLFDRNLLRINENGVVEIADANTKKNYFGVDGIQIRVKVRKEVEVFLRRKYLSTLNR